MRSRRTKLNTPQGLTLPELLIATIILLPLFVGTIFSFIKCMELSEMARHSSMAVLACKNKMAEIENTTFAQVYGNFNNTTFTTPDLNGTGVVYVNNSNPDVLEISASFSWRERTGRVFGEDQDLDGQIDAGEDVNGNGILDSIVQLASVRVNL
ncbi:MAG TPA: hypothetical protein PLT76_08240 [Candidatus Omnitrophota bacterium]|nr:hypothetical protein [Candidatus Omnitrophota bacterium]HPB67929.1 hypothetical protein [Candidatus Omnitrophota bacterium]HQO58689.1 hypothetical protein [Candidatus Omnitrophota bacterium]